MSIDSTKSIQENYTKYAKYFEDTSSSMASPDTFYKLLLSEMTNQDPLEPTSNSEFVSQMASFTSLQHQTDALYYQQANYATGLAGKTVTIASDTGTGLAVDTGVVTAVDLSDENNFVVTVNGKQYSVKNVMAVNETVQQNSPLSTDGAYATSLIGKSVTASTRDASGASVIEKGVVDSIEIENGVFRAIINGFAYPVDSIVKVDKPEEQAKVEAPGTLDEFIPEGIEDTSDSSDIAMMYGQGAYAIALIEKTVTVEITDDVGVTYYRKGMVESVKITDGVYTVTIADEDYPLDAIIMVEGAPNQPSGGYYDGPSGDISDGIVSGGEGTETPDDVTGDITEPTPDENVTETIPDETVTGTIPEEPTQTNDDTDLLDLFS